MNADGELVAGYIASMKVRGLSPATIKRRRAVYGMLRREYPDATFETLSPAVIEEFLSRRTAPQTRRSYLCDLDALYRWAIRRGHLTSNPCEALDKMKVPSRLPTPMAAEDLERAIASTDGMLRLAIMLGAYAGLRRAEIAALRVRDVDLANATLTVRHGKGGKDRTVPLHPDLAPAVAESVEGRSGSDAVVRGSNEQGVVPCTVSSWIRSAFAELGIRARTHDLRHTFGTEVARMSGGNVVLTSQLLGHSSVATTQRYIGWTPAATDVVAQLHRRTA